jgi:branched-chain amino acid transport system substrate-binding protein
MSKTVKIVIWVIVVILIILGIKALVAKEGSQPQSGERMKVGAILPLTGPIADVGQYSKYGAEFALAKLAEDNDQHIDLAIEDGQYDPRITVSAYNKLKTTSGVDALIAFGTPSANALAPLANQEKVPLFGLLAAPNYSTPNDYTYRMFTTSDTEAKFAADVLVTKLNKKRIGVLYLNNDYGIGGLAAFKKYIGNRASVVAEEGAVPGVVDYRSQLTKIRAAQPDAIFLITLYKETGQILKQAREMGMQGPFMCGQPCYHGEVITIAGPAAEGLVVVAPTENDRTGDIHDEYTTRFGVEPSYHALRTYDAVMILNEIAKECANQGYVGECLKKEIDTLSNFPGSSYLINFDDNGDINDQVVTKVIRNGQYVLYEQ